MRSLRCTTRSAALLLLCGCNSLLGIEPLQHGAGADAGGGGQLSESQLEAGSGGSAAAGSSGKSATGSGAGGKPAGGVGAAGAGASAQPSGASGARSAPAAGSGGSAGASTAPAQGGSSGTAGNAPVAPSTGPAVHGRVIDFRRNPLPDTEVRIGAQSARTDKDGRFTIDGVPDHYDVTLSLHTVINNANARGAFQVQGLTRRDPTIQIYRGVQGQSANALFKASNVSFPLRKEQRLAVTWASPLGETQSDITSAPGTMADAYWMGAPSSSGNAHALLFEVSDSPETPTAYTAHDTHALTLQDGASMVPVNFDLTAQTIATEKVSGTLSGPRDNRVLHFFLRFSDDTTMALPSLYPSDADVFSFLAPKLPGASMIVLFENSNNGRNTGQSGMFVDNVMPGQTDLALTLPAIPSLISPPFDKADVGADTDFEWTGSSKVYLLCAESTNFYESACVLTGGTKARLPLSPLSDYVPSANNAFGWTVETHNSWNSVDEACGEGGFISAGYRLSIMPQVPRGPGSWATSGLWTYTTPP